MNLIVTPFFDEATSTYSYVLIEPRSRACAVIDPVLDYNPATAATTTAGADRIVDFVKANDLIVEWLLETHVHADHLSAGRYLKSRFVCAQYGVGAGIREVQGLLDPALADPEDSGAFDRLFQDDDRIRLGDAVGRVMATPGHTPGCVCYRFEDLLFVGDTIFMPDFGSGRCDFPGGDASVLYRSVQRILGLPEETRLFLCHDYGAEDRPVRYLTTVAEQRRHNVHLRSGTTQAEFVRLRAERDDALEEPALMRVAVPFNLRGGRCASENAAAGREAAA